MTSDAGFDPMAVVRAFNRHGVNYVVIGGFAAELHQAPVEPTRDIDFTPSTTDENLARLSAALSDLGARIRTDAVPGGLPFSHDAASLGRANMWNLTSNHGDFDVSFKPSGTDGYDDLVRDALRLTVDGQVMPVSSLADVIRSKEAAGRQKDARGPARPVGDIASPGGHAVGRPAGQHGAPGPRTRPIRTATVITTVAASPQRTTRWRRCRSSAQGPSPPPSSSPSPR